MKLETDWLNEYKLPQPVIFFDGVCNLCNSSINYIIDRDPKGYFKFCLLQSETGDKFLIDHKLTSEDYQTLILIENNHLYTRSTAILKIAKRLKGPIRFIWFFILLPQFLRDPIYIWIANNRYKWFGKSYQCNVPTPNIQNRFI